VRSHRGDLSGSATTHLWGLQEPSRRGAVTPDASVDHQVNEALTNLYVGLQREARGERLSAARLIQSHAVDRILTVLDLDGDSGRDEFAVERRVEMRYGADVLPLAEMVPGYEHNREAALVILTWLEARADVDETLAAAIRALAAS
jgi:hypothetical protein